MIQIFRQSSGATVNVGPFVYRSGITVVTGVSVPDLIYAELHQNTSAATLTLTGGNWVERSSGNYYLIIGGASTATAGNARCYFQCSGSSFLPCWEDVYIMHSSMHDLFLSGAWSGVSIGGVSKVNDFTSTAKGTLGGVTVAGVSKVNEFTSNAKGTLGGVTIAGVSKVDNFTSTAKGTLGGVTVAGVSRITAISPSGVSDIFDAGIDGSGVSGFSLKECIKIQNAVLFGESSGGGGTTNAFRDLADGKSRVQAVVDANGNRTTISWDGT